MHTEKEGGKGRHCIQIMQLNSRTMLSDACSLLIIHSLNEFKDLIFVDTSLRIDILHPKIDDIVLIGIF